MNNWVRTNAELKKCCEVLQQLPLIGLDTEFMRTNTFFPIPALIQVSTADQVFFLDPQSITDFSPLREILDSEEIVKIMHAIGEDVELLRIAAGARLARVFDTQIAAVLCNKGFSLGYAALVKKLLDIDIEKGETRSNWLARPLSEAQEKYAAADVVYLHQLYNILASELNEKNFMAAVYEDTDRLISQSHIEIIDDYYLKLRGGWRLPKENQHALKYLCIWRENKARSKNTPRSRIIDDNTLIEIATVLPKDAVELNEIHCEKPWVIKKQSDEILAALSSAAAKDVNWGSLALISRPLDSNQQLIYKKLKKLIARKAEEVAIPFEILANKKMLEKTILQSYDCRKVLLAEELLGWRGKVIGDVVKDTLQQEIAAEFGSSVSS